MEAMAAGRVIIGSEVGGIPELVKNKKTGFLVPSKDVDALENRIRWCLKNTDKLRAMGKEARGYAKKNFGVERMVERYQNIYEHLAST